jgi:hypothetical protein
MLLYQLINVLLASGPPALLITFTAQEFLSDVKMREKYQTQDWNIYNISQIVVVYASRYYSTINMSSGNTLLSQKLKIIKV